MNKLSSKIWPYAIAISIFLIFIASIATIIITSKMPVQDSDTYMMNYHEADDRANEIIKQSIEFNKKYKIEYIKQSLTTNNSTIKYRVSDIESNPINDALIKVVVTRPNSHEFDMELTEFSVEDGVYTFKKINLAKEGRWDIMAKVSVGDIKRFYNVKVDTRSMSVIEY